MSADSDFFEPFDLTHASVWWQPLQLRSFRAVSATATYEAHSPFAGLGRFGDGKRLVLYVANSADGALAEFYRHHPELLELRDFSRVRVFELTVSTSEALVDVRTNSQATLIGIAFDRLISNDKNVDRRYAECRRLAQQVDEVDVGIAYASAALANRWNLALFGKRDMGWMAEVMREVTGIPVDESQIRTLD